MLTPNIFLQTATAVAHAKEGRGLIRINGSPINILQPEILRFKIYEPILAVGEDSFSVLDIRCRVKGGGHTSQVYALRQAIAKALVAYHAKFVDAYSAMELKKKLVAYDRSLLIADPRRAEPKKFGGRGARARRQKSYVAFYLPVRGRHTECRPCTATGEESHLYCCLCALSCLTYTSPMQWHHAITTDSEGTCAQCNYDAAGVCYSKLHINKKVLAEPARLNHDAKVPPGSERVRVMVP